MEGDCDEFDDDFDDDLLRALPLDFPSEDEEAEKEDDDDCFIVPNIKQGEEGERRGSFVQGQIDDLVQERCNSIANALELSLSCTNPLIF